MFVLRYEMIINHEHFGLLNEIVYSSKPPDCHFQKTTYNTFVTKHVFFRRILMINNRKPTKNFISSLSK